MVTKAKEKEAVLKLRKRGLSYNEILKKVAVSKSTLSVWLRDVGVAERHRQRFTLKRKQAQLKAQEACRVIRRAKEKSIIGAAKKDIGAISRRELWIIGAILYWAEGTKQREHNVSQRVSFNNSDPKMVFLFNRWLQEICLREKTDLTYSIYIHRTADKEAARRFWGNLLQTNIDKMYFKSHNPKTNRKNINTDYFGLLRIDVKKSTDLNRKIKGWILGISENLNI